MKHMKKAICLLLALVMTLALATTAGATTQTVTNKTNHTYKAYQIFFGTHSADPDADATLYNVQWGSDMNITGDKFLDGLLWLKDYMSICEKGSETFSDMYAGGLYEILYQEDDGNSIFMGCSTAADYARVLSDYDNNSDVAMAFARIVYRTGFSEFYQCIKKDEGTTIPAGSKDSEGNWNSSSVTLDPGYYLIVDTSTIGDNQASNLALLQVTGKGDIEITSKTGTPTVEKFVREVASADADDLSKGTWKKTADASIKDNVYFRLVGTLPENYGNFNTYKYVFHDTLSAGITLDQTSVAANLKVYLLSDTADEEENQTDTTLPTGWTLIDSSEYTVAFDSNDAQKFTVTFADLKTDVATAAAGNRIVVQYSAKLNEGAEIGRPGNTNTVKLEYSSDPNFNENISLDEPVSFTTEDVVRVFTYKLDVTKIDGNATTTKLQGAKFKLYKGTGENKQYVTVNTNKKVTGWTTTAAQASEFTTNEDGQIAIIGLDAGTYYLTETAAPTGYNTLTEPIEVLITSTLDDSKAAIEAGDALSALTITVGNVVYENNDPTEGVVSMNVANYKGATLPETGGIGTTLFYVIGGVLVAGAAVVLITRKRVRDEQ